MLRKNLLLTLGSISMALAACGGGGGGSSITIEDFCAEDTGGFSQFVNKLVECTPEFELILGETPSEASIAAACNAQFGSYIEDGTVEFGEKEELDGCIAAILAADCETLNPDDLPACDNITIGTLEEGEVCESDDQCAGDSYCTEPASGSTCGGCAPLLDDGATCTDGNECVNNYCRTDGTCGAYGLDGSNCTEDDDCSGRLTCNDGSCGSMPNFQVGDACTEFTGCGFPFTNLFCNEQAMMCEAWIALGEDCFDGTMALGFCDLVKYETCDTQGTRKCVAATIVGEGDQCGFGQGLKCEPGLACEGGDNGRCTATGLGADCIVDGENQTCGLFLECKSDGKCGYEDEYTGMCPAADA